jgi:RHS repeat-associated protein
MPVAAATVPTGGQGANLPGAALNTIPSIVSAPTLPLKFVGSASGTNVTVRPDIELPPAPATRTELPDKRTEYSRTYANPNGTFTLEASQGRLNYKDASGAWQPIDTTLVAAEAGSGWDYTQKANDKKLRISKANPETALTQLSVGPYTIGLRIPGIGAFTATTTSTGTTFASAKGSFTIASTPEGFEFSASLESASVPTSYSFALQTGGLVATLAPDELSITLTDPEATDPTAIVGVIGMPLLIDASGIVASPSTVTVSLSDTESGLLENETLVTYAIDKSWLKDKSRAYPVTLDPSVCIRYGDTGCGYNGSGDVTDTWVGSGGPDNYPYQWAYDRIGQDARGTGYATTRSLLWFQFAELPDGAAVNAATLTVREISNYGPSEQPFHAEMNTGGFSATTTWNTKPATSTTLISPSAEACSAPCTVNLTVTDIVRSWYTKRADDWNPNLGFTLKLNIESNSEIDFNSRWIGTASYRPKLTISYGVGANTMAFDPDLGADFAPAAMLPNTTVNLPIKFTNKSNWDWKNCTDSTNDCWFVGYRWLDALGHVVTVSGATPTQIPAQVNAGATSDLFSVEIKSPPAGQYTLRLDMVRRYYAEDLWMSDWAQPYLYFARAKTSSSPSNTHWGGTSVVERNEYPMSVGSSGETKTVSLPDGSALGINLWARNLQYSGSTGLGFADLGTSLGVGYNYSSAEVGAGAGVLGAMGWFTNYDERFEPGAGTASYIYRDPSGAASYVGPVIDGALTGVAGGRVDRVRVSWFDENLVPGGATDGSWTNTPPVYADLGAGAYSGTHAYRIASADNTNGTQAPATMGPSSVPIASNAAPISLNAYGDFSFAVKTDSANGAAIGLYITDNTASPPVSNWLFYTIGTDWALPNSSWYKINIPTPSPTGAWAAITARNTVNEAAVKFGVSANHRLDVSAIRFLGKGGSGNVYYDAIRFESRPRNLFDTAMPPWTGNGSAASQSTDHDPAAADTYAIKVTTGSNGDYAHSPYCDQCSLLTGGAALTVYPFMAWSWKKTGGNTVAVAFTLYDQFYEISDTITYYAGPTPPAGAPHPIQVSPTVPVDWTPVIRNVLEDGRQELGFYNGGMGGTSEVPNSVPGPDDVAMLAFRLIAGDGSYALFDTGALQTLPETPGTQQGDITGDDFLITYAGGATHRFNEAGVMTSMADANGNVTTLAHSYDSTSAWSAKPTTGARYSLTAVVAPSDGQQLADGSGTAVRRIVVERSPSITCGASGASSCVRFTEKLGSGTETGRYAEFDVNSSGDLAAVIPARRSAACATSGASGCLGFTYTGAHLLTQVNDPRHPDPSSYYTTITWTSGAPTEIKDNSQSPAATMLKVVSFDKGGGGSYRRVAWQDADNAAVSPQAVRMADLSNSGSMVKEYAPVGCGANCAAATPADLLVAFQADGANNMSGQIRFRTGQTTIPTPCTVELKDVLAGTSTCGSPIVTRRGSLAGFAIDNYSDPIVAGLTDWSQSADQFAASVASGSIDRYRTFYAYNALGLATDTIVPIRSETNTTVSQTVASTPSGYWRLAETGSPSVAINEMGSPNGTYSSTAIAHTSAGPLVGVGAVAPTFNGTSHYVTVGTGYGSTSQLTLSAWIKPDSTWLAWAPIIDKSDPSGGKHYRLQRYSDTNELQFYDGTNATHGGYITVGSWNHVAAVVNKGVVALYINGVRVGQGGALNPLNQATKTDSTKIGATSASTPQYFKGDIAEAAIYKDKALAADQIAALYAASGSAVLQDQQIVYDPRGNPIQALDNFLRNPGFESSLERWTASGAGINASHYGSDPANQASALLDTSGYVSQIVQLVPGQTFRLQTALKETAGATTQITVSYEPIGGGNYVTLGSSFGDPAPGDWHLVAWDITLPMETSGQVNVQFKNIGGSSGVYVDEVALFTTYRASTFLADGLVDTVTEAWGATGSAATTVTKYEYGAPDTYATNLLANGGFASGTGSWTLDQGGATATWSIRTSDSTWTLRDGDATGVKLSGGNYGSTAAVNVTAGSGTPGIWQRVAATPGHTYSVSGLIAQHRLTCARLRLYFEDSSHNPLAVTEAPCTAKTGGTDRGNWAYQTLSAVAPANAAYVAVRVQGETPILPSDGWIWADQLRLIDGPTPAPYVPDAAVTPAIFPTRVTANYVSGGASTSEQNVRSVTSPDRWGRSIISIDPDGIGSMIQYAHNQTDTATVSDGLGNMKRTLSWDAMGNVLQSADPLANITTTTYNFANAPVDMTAPDGTKTHTTYNSAGRPLHGWANYSGDGSSHTGDQNLETSYTYNWSGWVTQSVSDDGGTGATNNATATVTHDLLGNAVTTTSYAGNGATGATRVTTSHFDTAGVATGVVGPIAPPAGSSAPLCPDSPASPNEVLCNSVSYRDFSGRTIESVDVYGVRTHTWYDIAGHAVRTIANYVVPDPGQQWAYNATQNIATDTTYDIAGRAMSAKSYLIPCNGTSSYSSLSAVPSGCVFITKTAYNALGRTTGITNPDDSWVHTVFTAAGRTDRTSRPGASGQADSDVAWTKSLYDAAGRQTTTLSDYDTTGHAGIAIEAFEGDSAGWDAGGSAGFLSGGVSSVSLATDTTVHTALSSLAVSAAANQGAEWTLPGTFQASHEYHARLWVYAPADSAIRVYLGPEGCSSCSTDTAWTAAAWKQIDVEWTPSSAPGANTVKLAVVNTGSSAVAMRIDDTSVWDTQPRSTSQPNPANVPASVTVFDTRGQVIESIAPPTIAGDPGLVTVSAYDVMGRLTSVTVNRNASVSGHTDANDTNLTASYAYDDLGRQTDVTDPAGHVTHLVYDRSGRTIEGDVAWNGSSSSLGIKATAAYDNLGQLLATCAPVQVAAGCNATNPSDARAWHYAYDAAGHQTSATPPDNAGTDLATTYATYDLSGAGRLISIDEKVGSTLIRSTAYGYDAAGRQTSVVVAPKPSGTALTTTVTLDSLSRQTQITVSGTSSDTLAMTHDALGRLTHLSRGGTDITAFTYNADGSAATRTDNNTYSYSFTYTTLGQLANATLPGGSGSTCIDGHACYGWGLDGNLVSRTWGASVSGAYGYDGAKRPVSLTLTRAGASEADTFARTYDLAGNAASETQNLGGVSTTDGLAGGETQYFEYDAANRLTASHFSGDVPKARSYTYDANGNRTSVTEGSVTFAYTYDATDELRTKSVEGGSSDTFVYDSLGNLLTSQPSGPGNGTLVETTYTYDPAGHLLTIAAAGSPSVSFSIDALGRHKSQTISGSQTTYAYLGTSNSITTLTAASTTYSIIDAVGNRLATSSGGVTGYLVPDLHGNVAASVATGTNPSFLSAFRYDAYGETCDSYNAGGNNLAVPWRYQGRIRESASSATDLYDFGARSYDPSLGAFTSFDSVSGSALNPLSLNRYLYALANPASLIDPSGHSACVVDNGDYSKCYNDTNGGSAWTEDQANAGLTRRALSGAKYRTYTQDQIASLNCINNPTACSHERADPTAPYKPLKAATQDGKNWYEYHDNGQPLTDRDVDVVNHACQDGDVNACDVYNDSGWAKHDQDAVASTFDSLVTQVKDEVGVALFAAGCLIGCTAAVTSVALYAGVTYVLNRLTGRPAGEGLDPLSLGTAAFGGAVVTPLNAMLKPVAGWFLTKTERFGVGFFTGGTMDALTQLVQGRVSPVHTLCESVAGGLSNMGPEGKFIKGILWGGGTGIFSYWCPG